jgi:nucleoside-diphosphate-sugar epimerase
MQGPGGTALITGITGFVGGHLAARLRDDGWDVHGLIRGAAGVGLADDRRDHVHDGTQDTINDIVRSVSPDVVFHLAAHYVAEHDDHDVAPLVDGNVTYGTQLLEAMTGSGVGALVNAGTAWQNFASEGYRPVNLYAATKQAFEDIIVYYADAGDLRAVTLRLSDIFGPRDQRMKLLGALMRALDTGERLALSPGDQLIDLVYIDDVVEAFIAAARRARGGGPAGHEVFAVSSGEPRSVRSVVETFGRLAGRRLDVDWGGRDYRRREVMVPWSGGRPLPGWAPKVTLEAGIARMLEDHV